MKSIARLALTLTLGLLFVVAGCASIPPSQWPGRPLPPLPLAHSLQGPSWSASDARGKVTVLEIWQVGCPGCMSHSMPSAQRLYERYADDPRVHVQTIATALHKDKRPDIAEDTTIRGTLRSNGWTVPTMRDAHDDICDRIPVGEYAGTPTALVIDEQGVIRWHGFHSSDEATAALHAMVERLLAD